MENNFTSYQILEYIKSKKKDGMSDTTELNLYTEALNKNLETNEHTLEIFLNYIDILLRCESDCRVIIKKYRLYVQYFGMYVKFWCSFLFFVVENPNVCGCAEMVGGKFVCACRRDIVGGIVGKYYVYVSERDFVERECILKFFNEMMGWDGGFPTLDEKIESDIKINNKEYKKGYPMLDEKIESDYKINNKEYKKGYPMLDEKIESDSKIDGKDYEKVFYKSKDAIENDFAINNKEYKKEFLRPDEEIEMNSKIDGKDYENIKHKSKDEIKSDSKINNKDYENLFHKSKYEIESKTCTRSDEKIKININEMEFTMSNKKSMESTKPIRNTYHTTKYIEPDIYVRKENTEEILKKTHHKHKTTDHTTKSDNHIYKTNIIGIDKPYISEKYKTPYSSKIQVTKCDNADMNKSVLKKCLKFNTKSTLVIKNHLDISKIEYNKNGVLGNKHLKREREEDVNRNYSPYNTYKKIDCEDGRRDVDLCVDDGVREGFGRMNCEDVKSEIKDNRNIEYNNDENIRIENDDRRIEDIFDENDDVYRRNIEDYNDERNSAKNEYYNDERNRDKNEYFIDNIIKDEYYNGERNRDKNEHYRDNIRTDELYNKDILEDEDYNNDFRMNEYKNNIRKDGHYKNNIRADEHYNNDFIKDEDYKDNIRMVKMNEYKNNIRKDGHYKNNIRADEHYNNDFIKDEDYKDNIRMVKMNEYKNNIRADEHYNNDFIKDEDYNNDFIKDEDYKDNIRMVKMNEYKNNIRDDEHYKNNIRKDEDYNNDFIKDEDYNNDFIKDEDYKDNIRMNEYKNNIRKNEDYKNEIRKDEYQDNNITTNNYQKNEIVINNSNENEININKYQKNDIRKNNINKNEIVINNFNENIKENKNMIEIVPTIFNEKPKISKPSKDIINNERIKKSFRIPFNQDPEDYKKDITKNIKKITQSSNINETQTTNNIEKNKERTNKSNEIIINNKTLTILKLIGKGGCGRVYSVLYNNEIYALKKIRIEGENEAIINSHRNEIQFLEKFKGVEEIVQMIEFEEKEDELLILMEFGECDLTKIIKQYKNIQKNNDHSGNCEIDDIRCMPLNAIRYFWVQILNIVRKIHNERIIHRDLKPANFLLVKGRLKLIDFGISKTIRDNTTNIHTNTQVGTINYMAPEAIESNKKLGRSADIWSLGCILYEMVYGRVPLYKFSSLAQKCNALIQDKNFQIEFPNLYQKNEKKESNMFSFVVKTMKNALEKNIEKRATLENLLSDKFADMDNNIILNKDDVKKLLRKTLKLRGVADIDVLTEKILNEFLKTFYK